MACVNQVANIADEEGRHQDIHIFYGVYKLELWTHSLNGFSQ